MGDCQIVLRFFTLLEDEFIKGSMHSILDGCMKRNQNATPEMLDENRSQFVTMIEYLLVPFMKAKHSFYRRMKRATGGFRSPYMSANMVALFSRRDGLSHLIERRGDIRAKVTELLASPSKLELLTGKANTAQSIKDRIAEIGSILDNVS